ncbi:SRPBCC family protein [Marinobacter mangrovi]|uniref:SRPBCC family protein n=1 Tax=Marinobacter mangrovi TaxID=2803918 RepID=UPI00193302E5|nr:SRPBCC family protein [Marinobacter mangrovi]
MQAVCHVSTYIARSPEAVYAFASDPRNLPQWAAGLARSDVRPSGEEWMVDAPFGRVTIRFARTNEFGVMDHDVTLDSGVTVHNPMRVVPNGEGSEFIFTLFRRDDMTEDQFDADRQAVEADLASLKALLESKPGSGA